MKTKIMHLIEILTIKRNNTKSLNEFFKLGNTIIALKNTLTALSA